MPFTFVQWIDRQSWFHGAIRILRVRPILSSLLGLRPLIKKYPSGAQVRIADLESFYLSDEIFQRETYRCALSLAGEVKTVMDIGCNVGFFCCYLRHFYGRADFEGIGLDANPAVLRKAEANLALNGLRDIKLIHGLAGATENAGNQDFHVYASHLGSSQFVQTETGRTSKGSWTRISVPALNPDNLWQKTWGDRPIDFLKIDIEGSEGKLLDAHPELFRRAKCLVLEWHKWLVREDELFPRLRELGFTHQEKLEATSTAELWFFSR